MSQPNQQPSKTKGVRYFLILSSINLTFSVIAVVWFYLSDLFGVDPLTWKIQYWWVFLGVLGQLVAIILWLTPWIEKKLHYKAENMIRKLKLSEEISSLKEAKIVLLEEINELKGDTFYSKVIEKKELKNED